jgi:uroporphyrin-III C-methyltransferase
LAEAPPEHIRRGSLTVVGTGIDAVSQLTPAARGAIEGAEEIFYLLADPVAARRIESLNPRASSLDHLYGPAKARRETYAQIVETIVGTALGGARVCLVVYGHPGVFAVSGHEAIKRVRAAGLPARMLPAVSALDCLIADLGVDPATSGLQTYEATYYFLRRPPVDLHATLVLLQVGMLGETIGAATEAVTVRFRLLLDHLAALYGPGREAVLYEASPYPGTAAAVERFALGVSEIPDLSVMSTLCVTGAGRPPVDPEARQAFELSERRRRRP